jgi:dihydroxy-acid dehydratase
VEWTLDDFERVRRRVPVICDLKPSGRYMATDLHRAGGTPQVLKILLDAGLIDGECPTSTAASWRGMAAVPGAPPAGQTVIRPLDAALYAEGHLAVLRGNLAPDGAVAKISGLKKPLIRGPARVFEDEASAMEAILSDRIRPGDVLVLRYLGPRGGPGMPEMLAPTSALVGRGLGESVGLVTDGRFSGGTGAWWSATSRRRRTMAAPSPGTRGRSHSHRRPPAPAAGRGGRGRIGPAPTSLAPAAARYTRGVLAKFARLARPASEGAVTVEAAG